MTSMFNKINIDIMILIFIVTCKIELNTCLNIHVLHESQLLLYNIRENGHKTQLLYIDHR